MVRKRVSTDGHLGDLGTTWRRLSRMAVGMNLHRPWALGDRLVSSSGTGWCSFTAKSWIGVWP